ncbi:hypothetical protein OAK38_02610 [Verrucomicrobia bacterium]|nr:hypothetical protein [Verrucomicrobiota bacterium]
MQITVKRGDQLYGPYTVQELEDFLNQGNFKISDLASSDGQNWMQISQLPGLGQGSVPATHPSSPQRVTRNVSAQGGQEVSSLVIEKLAGTQGWVRFFSVLGFIVFGLMMLVAVGALFLGSTGAFVSLVYIVMGALYFFPTLKLSQYASRIARLRVTKSELDLSAALEAQRSFWAFVGIVTLVVLCLYLVIILVTCVGAASMAF